MDFELLGKLRNLPALRVEDISQQLPATARTPSLNEPKPDVPSSDIGEPNLPGA